MTLPLEVDMVPDRVARAQRKLRLPYSNIPGCEALSEPLVAAKGNFAPNPKRWVPILVFVHGITTQSNNGISGPRSAVRALLVVVFPKLGPTANLRQLVYSRRGRSVCRSHGSHSLVQSSRGPWKT